MEWVAGFVWNSQLASVMNKWLKMRSVTYRTTEKEISNTVKKFLQNKPNCRVK